ncbi:MAG: hypothetical protein P8P71_10735 [Phycisphaerales bacterium]|nr:hypothetical protein [Phycisphaerales bacterium]
MLSLILASSLASAPQAFQQHCFDCHGEGASTGGLALDEYSSIGWWTTPRRPGSTIGHDNSTTRR